MKKLILILPLLVIADSCEPVAQKQTIVVTDFQFDNHLYTVKHDNHLFIVVLNGRNPSGVIHHPSCPCINQTTK